MFASAGSYATTSDLPPYYGATVEQVETLYTRGFRREVSTLYFRTGFTSLRSASLTTPTSTILLS
jgi:hypothetical protein